MLRTWVVFGALVATVGAIGRDGTPSSAAVAPVALRLKLIASTDIPRPTAGVEWSLENTSQAPVYVCQFPGIAFSRSWTCADGRSIRTGPGYPDSRALERRYFLELKPGEALVGYASLDVWGTPSGEIAIMAEFRSDQPGTQHGLAAWHGRTESAWLTVGVPKDPREDLCLSTEAKP